MLIPAGALSKLLDLLQINCDEKDLLNAIHTAKKELIGDTTSKDAMEMRSHGMRLNDDGVLTLIRNLRMEFHGTTKQRGDRR